MSPEELTKGSILKAGNYRLPQIFTKWDYVSDLNAIYLSKSETNSETIKKLIENLNQKGYWPTKLRAQTNPYIGPGPQEITQGDFVATRVGDKYDTSPFINEDSDINCISTGVYIKNMINLIQYLVSNKSESPENK
jgi:hypothetical protein